MISEQLATALRKILINDEGFYPEPYRDTKNLWTIGVGRLIGNDLTKLRLSKETVLQMLDEDICKHAEEMFEIFDKDWFRRQTLARQAAIFTLVYTLGRTKLMKFINTVPAIKAEQWDKAAELLLDTQWAVDVDPLRREGIGRDDRIAYMLRTGEFHDEYKIS